MGNRETVRLLQREKIERNQWSNQESNSRKTYNQLMTWSWEEIKSNVPQYFQRLNFTVTRCKGKVLEIGCGIGSMTKWISKSGQVKEIVAIDKFSEAIENLKSHNLPKVRALQMPAEDIKLDSIKRFDTVVICELLEHLYPDEEIRMLNALRPYISPETAFIVSTPIGWLDNPCHVRAFSKKKFKKHLIKHYGKPIEIDYSSGYSQSAFGYFNITDDYSEHVRKKIESGNRWYTDSQFEWAEKESIRRIYEQRLLFFCKIIKREIFKKGKIALLDYGCGDGYWSLFFSLFSACEVTGIDYNPLRLERARSVVKNAKFIEADLSGTSKHFGKFDIVFCSQLIEHVKDDLSFLKGIRNYLKDDGVLILGTPNESSFTHRLKNFLIWRKKTDHVHFYKEKKIRNKIEHAGFVIKDIHREVFFPGIDRLYYWLTSTNLGFKLLEFLTTLFPSQCSDYYFECRIK